MMTRKPNPVYAYYPGTSHSGEATFKIDIDDLDASQLRLLCTLMGLDVAKITTHRSPDGIELWQDGGIIHIDRTAEARQRLGGPPIPATEVKADYMRDLIRANLDQDPQPTARSPFRPYDITEVIAMGQTREDND